MIFAHLKYFQVKTEKKIQYYLKDKEKKTNGKCNTVFTQRS